MILVFAVLSLPIRFVFRGPVDSNTSKGTKVDHVVVLDIPQELPLGEVIWKLIADLRAYGGKRFHVNRQSSKLSAIVLLL